MFDFYVYMVYVVAILSCVMAYVLLLSVEKFYTIFQQYGYKDKSFVKWLAGKNNKYSDVRLWWSALFLIVLLILIIIVFLIKQVQYYAIVQILLVLMCFYYYFTNISSVLEKKPLVYTKRVKRIMMANMLINLVVIFTIMRIVFLGGVWGLVFLLLPVYFYISPYIIILANYLCAPIEYMIKRYYIIKASKRLSSIKNLKIIGITGSYGKTSTKFILTEILNTKYKTVCTPKSFNTPMGITKSILSDLKDDTEIFIVEMGADKLNDIKQICKFIKPDISILTSIGNQHLSTFKTFENIIITKNQIMDCLDEKNGVGVYNCTNEYVKDLYNKSVKNKISVGVDKDEYNLFASNVKVSENGSTFVINYNNETLDITTGLLGGHNITNILLGVAVAKKLEISNSQIQNAVKILKPIKSRLEILRLSSGAIIIDDSFNSNPNGSAQALSVLQQFKEKKKIVVTPGMVELGDDLYKENYIFGMKMAKVADRVYIVNNINKVAINDGLVAGGFDKENIYFYSSFNLAFNDLKQILTKNHILLIENDLPDNYL